MSDDPYSIPTTADIGYVHLNVADLDQSLAFYCGTLGFGLVRRYGDGSHGAAFVSAGGYHHHIGLNTWRSRRATPPPSGYTELYHLAVRYANRRDLAQTVRRVLEAGVSLGGATDHGVSHSVYLGDPDGNGVELTWDRVAEERTRRTGHVFWEGTRSERPVERIGLRLYGENVVTRCTYTLSSASQPDLRSVKPPMARFVTAISSSPPRRQKGILEVSF